MEKSILYNLIEHNLLHRWRKEMENENNFIFTEQEKKVVDEIKTLLGEDKKDLISTYCRNVENRMDELYYNISIKLLNFGVQIGMELQQAFAENED